MKRIRMIFIMLMGCMVFTSCSSEQPKQTISENTSDNDMSEFEQDIEVQRLMDSINKSIDEQVLKGDDKLAHKIPQTIEIIKSRTSTPNSAGGVDCSIVWKNKSEKVIKYVTFSVSAVNAVDDVVTGDYNHSNVERLAVTGPIKPNQTSGNGKIWECVWYNSTIDHMNIVGVKVEFMDGETISTSDDKIISSIFK
jgi:hypothetical protein